jgi:hypothetical protein
MAGFVRQSGSGSMSSASATPLSGPRSALAVERQGKDAGFAVERLVGEVDLAGRAAGRPVGREQEDELRVLAGLDIDLLDVECQGLASDGRAEVAGDLGRDLLRIGREVPAAATVELRDLLGREQLRAVEEDRELGDFQRVADCDSLRPDPDGDGAIVARIRKRMGGGRGGEGENQ